MRIQFKFDEFSDIETGNGTDHSEIIKDSKDDLKQSNPPFKYRAKIQIEKIPLENTGMQGLQSECAVENEVFLFQHTEDKWIIYCEKLNDTTILNPPLALVCEYNHLKESWVMVSKNYRDIVLLFTLNQFGDGLGPWSMLLGDTHSVEISNLKPELYLSSTSHGKQVAFTRVYDRPGSLGPSSKDVQAKYKQWKEAVSDK